MLGKAGPTSAAAAAVGGSCCGRCPCSLPHLLLISGQLFANHQASSSLLRSLSAGFSQYLGLSLGADAMAAAVTSTTGLAIAPPFNNPYASTSREQTGGPCELDVSRA